jgi:hypothetical protein
MAWKCSPAVKPLEQKWLLENAAVLTEIPKSLLVGKPEIDPIGREWRYIAIALKIPQKGERKAQSCAIAWFRKP